MVKTKKLRAAGSHRSADSKGLPPGWIRVKALEKSIRSLEFGTSFHQADFKVESRSKPGAYFYAHPATKRTQAEHPGERQGQTELNRAERGDFGDFRAPWGCRHISSKRPEGPRRRKTEAEAEEPGQLVTVKTQ